MPMQHRHLRDFTPQPVLTSPCRWVKVSADMRYGLPRSPGTQASLGERYRAVPLARWPAASGSPILCRCRERTPRCRSRNGGCATRVSTFERRAVESAANVRDSEHLTVPSRQGNHLDGTLWRKEQHTPICWRAAGYSTNLRISALAAIASFDASTFSTCLRSTLRKRSISPLSQYALSCTAPTPSSR